MMSVLHNTRSRGVVRKGSLPESGGLVGNSATPSGRDDMPGLAQITTRAHVSTRREERGPSMFQGGRNGDNSDTGNGKTQFGSERVKFTKFLGVILHENLTWANHVSYLANKIHKSIGILKALQPKLPISSLHMLLYTLSAILQHCLGIPVQHIG